MKVVKVAAIVIGAAALIATGVGFALGATTIGGAFVSGLGAAGIVGASAVGGTLTTVLGAVALGALAIDATMLSSAIAPKPSGGGSQAKWKADPYAGIPYVMGRTLTSGNIVYRRGHGANNKFNTFVTVLSLGAIASIDTTFMDKTAVAFDGAGAAAGTYAGQIWQATQLGASPEASALTPPVDAPPGWTADHKLSGLAAAMNSFAYDAKSQNGLTAIPQPAWLGHWVKVYDPRLDSTYPGGSGSCRAYDESTYVWSEDPHLHGLTWAMGRYQNGVRVAGIGLGNTIAGSVATGIDVASFVEGANLNDARGWTVGGQVYTRPDTLWGSLKAMLQAGGAKPVLVGGKISCVNKAPRVSLATIGRGDIIGKASLAATPLKRSRINTIIPQYRSEAHDWEVVSAAAVSVADFVTLDGDERTREQPYPLVQDVDQVSQLAVYDVYDAREAGPGTVPLKPWWLNYRIGDCVTFAPEDDWSLKCLIEGRGTDAQSGAVTYTLKGETDGKHPYALGQSGTAPPIASFSYDPTVAAPDVAEWTLTGATISAQGVAQPVLEIDGACANGSADAVVWDYRVYEPGAGDEDNWIAAGVDAPGVVSKKITGVLPGTQYEVSVRYRVRGVPSPGLILGPVPAGVFAIGGVRLLVSQSLNFPISSGDDSIDIAAFDGVLNDGSAIGFPADTISGLSSGTTYALLWDIAGETYLAVAEPANAEMASSSYAFLGWQATSTSGVFDDPEPPPPGHCVSDDTPVLLADGSERPAGDLVAGDVLRTRHERTMAWGDWPIVAISFAEEPVFACALEGANGAVTIRASAQHRFLIGGRWMLAGDIGAPVGTERVAKITVAEAHTYVSAGVLSHNIKSGT